MKHIIMVIAILGLMALNLKAQDAATKQPQKFSLQEAVAYAKKYNYTLKNSSLEVLAAENKVKEILALGLPNITASGTFMNNIQVPTQSLPNFLKSTFVGSAMGQAEAQVKQQNPNATQAEIDAARKQAGDAVAKEIPDVLNAGFGRVYSLSGSIDASQLLFDGGFLMGLKASKEYVNLSKINLKRTEVETEVSVSKSYYMTLMLQTKLELVDVNLKALEKASFDLTKLAENGLIDKIESDRLILQLSSLQLQKDQLVGDIKTLTMVLKLQMGLNVNDNIELSDDLMKMYAASKTNVLPAKGDYTNRLEYQMVNQGISLYKLDKKRYQYGYVPSLVAFMTHQQNSFGDKIGDLGTKFFPGTYWGLKLSIPVFDGFKKQAQIQQAEINIKKAENDKKLLENAIDQEIFMYQANFNRASRQLDIQKRNFELAQEIFTRVNLKYTTGLGSSLDLTNAQRDLETARSSYLNTMYDYFVAQLDLRKAIGDLNK
jgi:outer membrane protein TolC